uniref:Desmoplakin b n=1 Tax=Mastacembelus armatus TaxID=205130 RepID=A0A7N8WX15_9TELE
TASWGDDPAAIEQQLINHQKFHSSIQRSPEVDRAKDDLQLSFGRAQQLRDLQQIIQQISTAIMWVNDREEEELVFDWGDKNIDQYIPKKQESYSKLMSALEDKEKDLNKLKAKVDVLLKNNHPASDKIEAYQDTLQTQWSWLLQITKCIDIHLKENAAYSQFFKEANETYSTLQKEHETIRKKFTCDKNTSLENLLELLRGLEREREKIMENKRQVQHLVNKSKSIVRLKPRNPEEKSSSPVIVKALCDFKQDQKVICKDNEAILKDNSQRSKWDVTGPGGLDMLVPSVCLIVPPPNPLSVSLAKKNEQYYEAILAIWNQLYINVKSLIAWQYCLLDIKHINSLTMTMLAKMRPEDYRQIFKNLENHFEEFKLSCHNSQMFDDEDKRRMETQVSGAQTHYEQLVVQLPTYSQYLKKTLYIQHCNNTAYHSVFSICRRSKLSFPLDYGSTILSSFRKCCRVTNVSCLISIYFLTHLNSEMNRRIFLHIACQYHLENKYVLVFFFWNDIDYVFLLHLFMFIRLQALRDMLQSIAQVEDIVKVHEARLTEKETTSLSTSEVQDYVSTLKSIKAELELKKNVLASMETQLANVSHWNSQVGGPYYRCDMMLSKYTEQVGLLSDRWKRIQGQIDTRLQDLQLYLPQLQHYTQTSTSLTDWIDATRKKQDSLQNTKIETVQALNDHINKQKALNTEIKAKRETVDSVLKDNDSCVRSVKDYETDLASYTSGLETLLNIPIKRTMLKSPTMDLNQEATQLQTRYMELFTLSGDYYKFLGELLKSMEELKIRNTRIDLLEEELRLLRENVQDHSSKNKSLEDALARYQLQLSQSQEQLLSIEEVKRNTAMQCSATKDSLNTTQSQLSDLNDQVGRLNYLLEEEKRKRRLAEERYTHQQEEYELVLRKRQKELETVSWSKLEVEKSVATKDQELEQLRRQLADEAAKAKELQKELSKSIQSEYSDIVKERDALLLKLQLSENGKDRLKMLEDELGRIKLSLDSELRNKQRLQEENDRVKRDLSYWKDQYDSKQSLIRQYDTDKEYLEREKNALKSEIERLMRELRELEETYKSRLSTIQKEMHEMTTTRIITETELRRTRESSTLDASTLIFDGVRKPVTANQLLDCGVLDKPTFSQLVNGQKTVPEVSVDKKVNLKGTGPIAGVVVGSQGKMSLSEAKKQMLLPDDSANLLLEAQAATGHIIDPRNNQKLTVEEACARGVVDIKDRDRLLAAEAAAVGYKHPSASKPLSVFEAMQKGLIDKRIGVRLLQAQESLGGILDPILSVFLPKDIAKQRNLIDEDLYQALNRCPECYVDPDTQQPTTYISLKRKCKTEPSTGLLLLPEPKMPLTVRGLRGEVSVIDLVDANLLKQSDVDQVNQGRLTRQDIEDRLRSYLRGSTCIAGVYDEANDKVIPIYQAMKDGLLRRGTTLELLEAQAASGFMVDPINNLYLTVSDAYSKNLFGPEFKDSLLAAESAVTGYKTPGTNKIISLFQAMEKGLIEKGHGIRLLQAQIASGGIIDPEHSHRIDVNVAYKRGYFNEAINKILTDEGDETKGFFDPNTDENLTYLQLKKRCITDKKTGLILLPIMNKKKQESTQKNTTRKRRVLIVDPETNREMTVREAYDKKFIDYDTYLELSQQECEWDEITITAPDGSVKFVIIDRKTGRQYDISELLEKKVIDQSVLDKYRSHVITLTEFADIITNKTTHGSFSSSTARPMASSSTIDS